MTKRALVTLSLLALMVPAGCKSSDQEANAGASSAPAATESAMTTEAADSKPAGTKAKPEVEKITGQKVDGNGFTMTVPNGWTKEENPAKVGKFEGLIAYASAGEQLGGYVDVRKATFPFTSDADDHKAVWENVQATSKEDFKADSTFGEDYESKDGFSYSTPFEGKKIDSYVYYERKGDTVYYVDAGGDLSKITEKDAWGIIESFETK